jgi:hypothetical protein
MAGAAFEVRQIFAYCVLDGERLEGFPVLGSAALAVQLPRSFLRFPVIEEGAVRLSHVISGSNRLHIILGVAQVKARKPGPGAGAPEAAVAEMEPRLQRPPFRASRLDPATRCSAFEVRVPDPSRHRCPPARV